MAFLATWYLFTILTYGTMVPAGLFLPGMIIGCSLGQVLFQTMDAAGLIGGAADEKTHVGRSYVILGCAGFMAGYTRMTYSLAVIIMETSNDIQIFLPIMMCVGISNTVGYYFTRSLYERAIRGKQIPMINGDVPPPCRMQIAENIMSKKLVTIQNVAKLADIKRAIETNHHAFPVLNSKGNFVGLMPRNFLLVLIEERHFYGSNIDATFASDQQEYTSSRGLNATLVANQGGLSR